MPISFKVKLKCVSVHNTYVHNMLRGSHKYYHLAAISVLSHLSLFVYNLFKRHTVRNNILSVCMNVVTYHNIVMLV